MKDYVITVSNHAQQRWVERVASITDENLMEAIKSSVIIKEQDLPPFPLKRQSNTTYCCYRNNVVFVCEAVDRKVFRVITVLTPQFPEDFGISKDGIAQNHHNVLERKIQELIIKKSEFGNEISRLRKKDDEKSVTQLKQYKLAVSRFDRELATLRTALAKNATKTSAKYVLLEVLEELRAIRLLLEEQKASREENVRD